MNGRKKSFQIPNPLMTMVVAIAGLIKGKIIV